MFREELVKAHGYDIESIWGCEWEDIQKTLLNKSELEKLAKSTTINLIDALFGGRTEGFTKYVKCNENQ